MLRLPDVTLCCIDTANHALALRALTRSQAGIEFARTLLLTDAMPAELQVPASIDAVSITRLDSRAAYSQFVLKGLGRYVDTSHVLLVQWDGFVVNPDAWTSEFLECDYLGAKWFWYTDTMRVGNGGFSLRSQRLLRALEDPRITLDDAEDTTIGRTFRRLLEQEYGIRFGSEALADRFAFEAAYPIGKPFGFHGLFNFCRVLSSAEIAELAISFPEAIVTSPQALQLMRNCAALGQWSAVKALATRIVAARPDNTEAAGFLRQVDAQGASMPVVGRNEPCPCGSGRKYKQCHGALNHSGVQPGAPSVASAVIEDVLKQGLAAHQTGDLSTAETAYHQVLHWNPAHPVALHYLGVMLYQRRHFGDALPLLTRAAEALPTEPEFHNNLGLALAALDRNDEAIAAYRRTLALKPQHAIAWNNMGLALTAINRIEEAIGAYREAIARAAEFGQAHWNLALALLAQGQFEEGWREYEWRLALAELGKTATTPSGTRWDGRIQTGTTLLMIAEQGLGDTIQFARFATPLAAAGMNVVLQAPDAANALLSSIPGLKRVITSTEPLPAYDAWLPLLSVAGALHVDGKSIPGHTPYIRADAQRRASLRQALASVGAKLKVGLSWAGSLLHPNDARRSMTLEQLQPLLELHGVAWFSLQRGVDHGAPLNEWSARNTLDGTAALIAELDLVITVDTSIAHLAGALHRPTWLLLSHASDWRWGVEGDTTAWYPSMRIFRQRTIGDWAGVVNDVRGAVESLTAAT